MHGDYRLDNLIVDAGRPRPCRAVLDWEMATLGDPLTDLGLLLTYWDVLGDRAAAGTRSPTGSAPAPASRSAPSWSRATPAASGVDVGPLDWHVALGCFKLAVIAEGIHYRYTLGQTVGEGFDRIGDDGAPRWPRTGSPHSAPWRTDGLRFRRAHRASCTRRLNDFMVEHVYPAEPVFAAQVARAEPTRGPGRRSSTS